MTDIDLPAYFEIYKEIIDNSNVKSGFKLIGGGTGFGKTKGISQLITAGATAGRKVIYCAHRKQLIENMKTEIADPSRYVVLTSNAEAVYNALQVHTPTLEETVKDEQLLRWSGSDVKKQKSILLAVQRVRRLIESPKSKGAQSIQSDAIHEAHEIIKYFRTALKERAKRQAAADHPKAQKSGKLKLNDAWLDHPIVYALFPFIEFQRTDKPILLTTVQKGFNTFFDGKNNTNLYRLRSSDGYLVFLDEFDFLEEELLSIICRSSLVDDPFTFVEYFYQEMTRHKMPHQEYATKEIQARITPIIDLVDMVRTYGIDYPAINQFTTHLEKKKSRPAIFSTSMTHLNQKLFLKQGRRSFEIYDNQHMGGVDAVKIFRIIYEATQEILVLLLELRRDNETQYKEILQQCYGKTDFYRQVERIHEVGRRTSENPHHVPLDALFDEGYGVYEINHIGYTSDKDEAEFRYYAIFNTPERMLRDLVKHNLVFALSATADIPRVVKHFDLGWLERQPGVNMIPTTTAEEQIIRTLSQVKSEQRGSTIVVNCLPELDLTHPTHLAIRNLAHQIARQHPDGADDPTTLYYRQQRTELFYRVLLWALNDTAPDRERKKHLVFVNSFREIQNSFETPNDVLKAEKVRENSAAIDVYELRDTTDPDRIIAIVIFYNAEAARALKDPITLQLYNEQFWKQVPVLVVTQYSSAGNGVNLQYLPTPESEKDDKTDFSCLHLLEAPYYFFNGWDSERNDADNIAALKQDIWHAAKLYLSHNFSKAEFLRFLNDLRGAGINSSYHRNRNTRFDVICNQVAALIQALGRVERVWKPIPAQTLMLSDDVFRVFQRYCTHPEFAAIREAREAFLSANLRAVQQQVIQLAQEQDEEAYNYSNTLLQRAEKLSIQAVDRLLRRLERLRAGEQDEHNARVDWIELRSAMLRHDFTAKVVQRYFGTCSTSHYHDGGVWVDQHLATYPAMKRPTDAQKWDFNFIYRTVSQNPTIRRHFEHQQYPMQFPAHLDRIPTRYFYQAILIGAIGEEAIRALLERRVELGPLDDALFELADLKVASRCWYIDCKNYGEYTLDNFAFDDDEDMREPLPKLNSEAFLKSAQHKLATLRDYHQHQDVKLIYLNLFSYKARRPNYLTLSLDSVATPAKAQIIVLPSVLDTQAPAGLHHDFSTLLTYLAQES